MDELQPLPLDTESFRKIRTAETPMLSVDKTACLHRLITDKQSSNFFLARPWRFGNLLWCIELMLVFSGFEFLVSGFWFLV